MATFDVRESTTEEIDRIQFWDNWNCDTASYIDKTGINSENYVLTLSSKQHANNLILALNKAIELGWLK